MKRAPGDLQIDVYSTKGVKLCNLFTGKMTGEFYSVTWNGKDPGGKNTFKGEYKIRWTTSGGCREFPVVVD
jgi:flagellar hook assembly protein FlgD